MSKAHTSISGPAADRVTIDLMFAACVSDKHMLDVFHDQDNIFKPWNRKTGLTHWKPKVHSPQQFRIGETLTGVFSF